VTGMVLSALSASQRRLVEAAIYFSEIVCQELAEKSGYAASSGGFCGSLAEFPSAFSDGALIAFVVACTKTSVIFECAMLFSRYHVEQD
jgi:hypothetical protein